MAHALYGSVINCIHVNLTLKGQQRVFLLRVFSFAIPKIWISTLMAVKVLYFVGASSIQLVPHRAVGPLGLPRVMLLIFLYEFSNRKVVHDYYTDYCYRTCLSVQRVLSHIPIKLTQVECLPL